MRDIGYWLWLSLIFETGSPVSDSLLYAFDHDPKAIYEADKTAIFPFCKNNDYLFSRLSDKRLGRVYSIIDFCEKENIGILTPENKNFPSPLLKISGHPLVLYYKGRLPDFSRALSIAVVGTRDVTAYGSSSAYTISHDLASSGVIVVSGMALGADTAAHRGALDAGGHTVAFLGCGIDIVYPKENYRLMQEIIGHGTVITEYAPGVRPIGKHFPVRNRLISGISKAVLVVEASERSGALITASHGLKQGKLIYAIPGKVGELASTGTNLLIQNGAKMVTSAKDIISDFSEIYDFRFSKKIKPDNAVPNYGVKPQNTDPVKRDVYQKNYIPQEYNFKSADFNNKFLNNTEYGNNSQNQQNINHDNITHGQIPKRFVAVQPRPTILYNGMTEEEVAASYMSLDPETRQKKALFPESMERVYLTYPKEPMPENGYEVVLSDEGFKNFENINESRFKTNFSETDSIFPIETYKAVDDPVAAAVKSGTEKNKKSPFKRIMSEKKEIRPKTGISNSKQNKKIDAIEKKINFDGLSETESAVLKFIFQHPNSGIDSMSELGIPVPKLLSIVTMLEIKKKIIQKPGGYFEIKNSSD